MEKPSPQEHDHAHAREEEDREQKYRQFKGIRLRKWGSWVSEIRMPRTRDKLWLGSYPSAQQAARAYDAAVHCLRGPNAKFNFPNSVPDIPSASSLSRRQIQLAAAKHALDRLPSSPPSLQNISNKATEEAASPSRSASISETELSSDSTQISGEQELDLMECLFEVSDGIDGCLALNLQRMPSIEEVDFREYLFEVSDGNDGFLDLNLEAMPAIEEVSALEIIRSSWQEQQEVDSSEYLFEGNDVCLDLNLERIPSIEEVSALELIRSNWQEQQEVDLRDYLFQVSDGNDGCLVLNLERMPSIVEVSALELCHSAWQEEEGHMNILIDPTELWNF